MTFIRLLLVLPAAIIGFILGLLFYRPEEIIFAIDSYWVNAVSTFCYFLAGVHVSPDKYKKYCFYILSIILAIYYSFGIYIIRFVDFLDLIMIIGCAILGSLGAFMVLNDWE